MIYIIAKAKKRIIKNLRKFQKLISNAYIKDINESDTSVIVTDIFSDLLGYDKYSEITTETAIRGTYCDFGIKIHGKPKLLVELKAADVDLKEYHVKQAIDYAANKGIDWAILTNGTDWHIYRICFTKPINKELIYEFDFTKLNVKNTRDLEMLYSISKEGLEKSVLNDLYDQNLARNKYILGNLLFSDDALNALRREVKRNFPKSILKNEDLKEVLSQEVIKREILEGDDAEFKIRKIKNRAKIK